ncbi:MAG: phosphohydrolase, partial [Epsilonproteobacteria bacterium]
MEYIKFLGASGARTSDSEATCIQISEHTVIDGGNLINGFGNNLGNLENILLTHAHFDHIYDIPFLAEWAVTQRTYPLKIYALKETLSDLKQYIFNNKIWPNFSDIRLLKAASSVIEFIEIKTDISFEIDSLYITPVKTNHTEGSCGFVVEQNAQGILITADTYITDSIWNTLNINYSIHSLCIDVSFPSAYDKLAFESKHLTPKLLHDELQKLQRDDVSVYPIHIKPLFYDQVVLEIEEYQLLKNGAHIISDGDKIYFNQDKRHAESVPDEQVLPSLVTEIANVGIALSSEKNIDRLLDIIITQAKKLTNSDGGTLYLLDAQHQSLEFKVIQTDSLHIKMGGAHDPITWKPLSLYTQAGEKNTHMVAVISALEDKVVNISDVYNTATFDFSGTKLFDKETGYRSKSMLVIPLKNHEETIIGVLQLLNRQSVDGEIIPFDKTDESITISLASQAAVALTKQQLISDLENLLESFLKTINIAIEEKSEYTAGHIEKMVEMSLMLTQAINENRTVFKEINYSNQELKEIKIAALMHDIGKITTPEYVIDKATKLHTIYDRIETVKFKSEIIKRDLKIEYLEKKLTLLEYENSMKQIDVDIAFLVEANTGGEFFSREKIARVKEIATRQISLNGIESNWLSDNEVFNLCIQKGTLTEEERLIINNHAAVSLRMLQQLPFPKKYARVPEIAGGHHEQINGKGYPLGLKGDELSLEARILAIADIFEALTVSDRPYKKAKKLSESMKTLYFMAKYNHLDRKTV